MPTDETILGWGNFWYKEAIQHSVDHKIAEDLIIKSVTAPYFLATKIEAFKSRGNNDFLGSHDFEDIITVIAGCVEIAEEIPRIPHLNSGYVGCPESCPQLPLDVNRCYSMAFVHDKKQNS